MILIGSYTTDVDSNYFVVMPEGCDSDTGTGSSGNVVACFREWDHVESVHKERDLQRIADVLLMYRDVESRIKEAEDPNVE